MKSDIVGVVGAGMMGAEIALVFALAGGDVLLTDSDPAKLDQARTRLDGVLAKGVERGNYQPAQRDAALAALTTTGDLAEFGACGLVVEAVFEDPEVKGGVYGALDDILAEDCILATNTSTIPIATLAGTLPPARAARFLGTHFFSPASRMALVEVIPGPDTADGVVESVLGLLREVGKEPIRVKDVAGFAVNRVLHAFLIEATRLVEEGVISAADLDTACRQGLGHPVGPLQLMDLTGNHLNLEVQNILFGAYGERFRPRPNLERLVAEGKLGRRTGKGWHDYD